ARMARADMVLTLFIIFSLTSFLLAYEAEGKKRFFFFILFFIGIALSTLTKGPVVVVFPLGIAAVYLFLNRKLKVFLEPGFLWGWLVFLLLILTWVIPYLIRVEISAVKEQFALTNILSRPEPFYYYLVEFWPRFAPWSFFLPSAVLFFFQKNPGQSKTRLFLFCWIVVIFVLIFPVHNKTYRYLLPIFPAYSLILSASLMENLLPSYSQKKGWFFRSWNYSTWFCFFIFISSFILAPFLIWWFTDSFSATLVVVVASVALGGVALIGYGIFRKELLTKILVISFSSLLIYEAYFYFITREDERHSPIKKVAEIIKLRINPVRVYTFGINEEKTILLDFYLDQEVPELDNPYLLAKVLNNPYNTCLISSEGGLKQILDKFPSKTLEVFPITHYKKATYFLITSKRDKK
ncbi:MAG: hypothetical protein N3A64_03220, partial [Desulfobacterota bacterium]|nr:hypothetical protein [Thermodesulfobacteriota bacterium]